MLKSISSNRYWLTLIPGGAAETMAKKVMLRQMNFSVDEWSPPTESM